LKYIYKCVDFLNEFNIPK